MKNRKDIMNNINLVFGLLLFVVFLITGYYMKEYFKPEHLNNIEQRLQIRSNHIYILFVSLLNITISICRFDKTKKSIYYLDLSLRILIVFTGILAFLAFCFEHTGEIDNRIFNKFHKQYTVMPAEIMAQIGSFATHSTMVQPAQNKVVATRRHLGRKNARSDSDSILFQFQLNR